MQEKKYNDCKKEIRSVLLTYQESVPLEEFQKTYKGLIGQRLPSKSLGFFSDVEFLQSMPDVVTVNIDVKGRTYLKGIADEKSEHIQKLVSKQRKPNGKLNNKKIKQPEQRLPNTSKVHTSVKELNPFLPGALKAEILQLMSTHQYGISFTGFALAYRKKFNKFLPLVKGMDSLESMIKLIPELEVTTENNEKKISYRNCESDNAYQFKSTSPEKNISLQEGNSFDIHNSGIPEDILHNLDLVVKRCPEGILDIHFPPLYEKVTGKSFDLHALGYNSLAELVDALPHILKRILNPEDNRTWIILPRKASIKQCLKDENGSSASHKNKCQPCSQEGIPADAASPALQYMEPSIPSQLDLSNYIPIFVSAIENPSLFWFQLQTEENVENFETFEEHMGMFYKSYGNSKYRMKDSDIAIGATCVILCPEDKLFYRAVIKSIPSVDFVNVLYVDYGSRDNISRNNLYYVRNKYHDFPACAFQAKLAEAKPPHNESTWSIPAITRFIELCNSAVLMAHLKQINKDTYLVALCNTNEETDIYLNEALINEGLAELCHDDQPSVNHNSPHNVIEDNHFGNLSTTYSENESLSENNQYSSQSDNNLNSSSKASSAKRALCFSSKGQYNGLTPNISSHGKRQDSKRYIKLMKLCEDTKLHFINFENKLYLSCGDLARLLWNDMDSDCLIERLKDKEVDVPFLELLKQDHLDLFSQCIWYQIPEFERLKSDNSSLIIYSLEWAFNVLNIFGHPSLCLRLAIQNEIKSFDPSDSFWKEFSYLERGDLDEAKNDFKQQISKLCLYDLKAKSQAFKITRLKLSRVNDESAHKEIRKIEQFHSIIEERIQEIESLCSMFSNYL